MIRFNSVHQATATAAAVAAAAPVAMWKLNMYETVGGTSKTPAVTRRAHIRGSHIAIVRPTRRRSRSSKRRRLGSNGVRARTHLSLSALFNERLSDSVSLRASVSVRRANFKSICYRFRNTQNTRLFRFVHVPFSWFWTLVEIETKFSFFFAVRTFRSFSSVWTLWKSFSHLNKFVQNKIAKGEIYQK